MTAGVRAPAWPSWTQKGGTVDMETLKILNVEGKVVLTQDLSNERGPLLVVVAGDTLRLGPSAAADERVIGAVVRTEDGWNLASSDAASPVVSGSRSEGDLPLAVGNALVLEGYVFRLETDVAASGHVLLWRAGKGRVSAENIFAGRNFVAVDGLTGKLSVNPAVARDVVCEFYSVANGVDVIAPDGTRLSVENARIFACGGFEGMVLEASEAQAAMKTRNPFSYPGRFVREGILLALAGAAAVFFFAAFLNREVKSTARLLEAPRGAERLDAPLAEPAVSTYFGDAFLYLLSAYREMTDILGPRPSPAAADLIRRAELMKDEPEVLRMATFLRQVTDYQETVLANRWSDLDAQLEKADREMFVRTDGMRFLGDLHELSTCANRAAPRFIYEITDLACTNREELLVAAHAAVEDLKDNIFSSAPEVQAFLAQLESRREVIMDYIAARQRVLSDGTGVVEIHSVYDRLKSELDEEVYRPIFDRENGLWKDYLVRRIEAILSDRERSREIGQLAALCDFADAVGISPDRRLAWNSRVKELTRTLEMQCQKLYQQYRLTAGSNPAEADRLLDELVSVSEGNEKFGAWARREKARRAETTEKKEEE